MLIAQKCLISVMSFPSPRRLPSVTSVALFTKGTRWWLDGLIHWDCFLANRMAAASAPHRRYNKPICTRMFLCLHSSYVSTLSVANTGHSCVQTEGHFTPHIGLFWGGGGWGLNRCCVSALWPVSTGKIVLFVARLREVFLPRAQMGSFFPPGHLTFAGYCSRPFPHS